MIRAAQVVASCKELLALVEADRDATVRVSSLINPATDKPVPGTLEALVRMDVRRYDAAIRRAKTAIAKAEAQS